MTTQLTIFNDTLALLGKRSLVSTGDATEDARVLTNLWDHTRAYCLEQGRWKFAEKQAQLTAAGAPPDAYGLTFGFAKPTDFVMLTAVASDAAMDTPVTFHEATGHIFSDTDDIYIRYISDDASFGYDLDLWPENFVLFVTYYLAFRAAPRIAPSQLLTDVDEQGNVVAAGHLAAGLRDSLQRALEFDTVGGPSSFYSSSTTTKLDLFNQTATALGLPLLTKITDATETARVLLSQYDKALDYCLAQGRWRWAEKQAQLTAAGAPPDSYGLAHAYAKPSDYITLSAIAADADFDNPVDNYHEAGSHFYSDTNGVYVQYTSNDSSFGGDIAKWPDNFTAFFVHYLAIRAAPRLSPATLRTRQGESGEIDLGPLNEGMGRALQQALVHDAITGPSFFLPDGVNTQLSIFNQVATKLGLEIFTKLTDAREDVKVLLNLWDHVRNYCLEQGRWRFAEKQTQLTAAGAPPGGYNLTFGFAKPTDFLTLNALATNEAMTTPVDNFHEAGGYIYSDSDDIYVAYTSNDASFGHNLTLWPEHFTNFVIEYMASVAAPRIAPAAITPAKDKQGNPIEGGQLALRVRGALQQALIYDTANGPSQFLPDANTKLSIFNNVMWLLGQRNLVQVTDSTEPARVLLGLWERAVDYCLEQGHWTFAEREAELAVSVTEVPTKGYANAFEKPSDFVRINWVAADEYFNSPIFEIHERTDFWYTDLGKLFIRYVSNGAQYGYDLTKWPETFTLYVTLYLATLAASRLAPEKKIELIRAPGNIGLEEAKYNALSKDAVDRPTQFLPQGNWVSSRVGRFNRGRNSNNSLYGN